MISCFQNGDAICRKYLWTWTESHPNNDMETMMCTMIAQQIKIDGSGKGTGGWFKLGEADVSYDHPFDAPFEHALNIDFVNESLGPSARVAVELSVESARAMVEAIQAVLEQAERGGYVK